MDIVNNTCKYMFGHTDQGRPEEYTIFLRRSWQDFFFEK